MYRALDFETEYGLRRAGIERSAMHPTNIEADADRIVLVSYHPDSDAALMLRLIPHSIKFVREWILVATDVDANEAVELKMDNVRTWTSVKLWG